jgi:hypothetical protein
MRQRGYDWSAATRPVSPPPRRSILDRMAPSTLTFAVCLFSAAVAFCARIEAAPATVSAAAPAADGEFAREPSWSPPTEAVVRQRVLEWLASSTAAADVAGMQRDAWPEPAATTPAADDLLDRVMATFAAVDPRCAALRADLDADRSWLDAGAPDFQRDAVKLWLGRELVRNDRFDDALPLFVGLDPAAAVDPAALLFHRAACQHWLLDADAAVESLDTLLERAGGIPVRYERLARLMRADITALEDESLDHIARRMRDVTRRLDQGRAGPRTREVQDGVIESLDKLIAAIEKQQQGQQQGAPGAGGTGRGGEGKPMEDSQLADGKGAGEVARRDLGDKDGWGNLPPHQRDEALQQIGREFPAHYREAIEQYFKRLAAGSESP